MARVRLELDGDGIRELLRDPEVIRGAVDAVADRARAGAAGILVEDDTIPVPITTEIAGRGRARGYVRLDHPAGIAVEAKHRVLGAALDAVK